MMLFTALTHQFETPIMCSMIHIKTSLRLNPERKIRQDFGRSENVLFLSNVFCKNLCATI